MFVLTQDGWGVWAARYGRSPTWPRCTSTTTTWPASRRTSPSCPTWSTWTCRPISSAACPPNWATWSLSGRRTVWSVPARKIHSWSCFVKYSVLGLEDIVKSQYRVWETVREIYVAKVTFLEIQLWNHLSICIIDHIGIPSHWTKHFFISHTAYWFATLPSAAKYNQWF